jgi:hypothetical protein
VRQALNGQAPASPVSVPFKKIPAYPVQMAQLSRAREDMNQCGIKTKQSPTQYSTACLEWLKGWIVFPAGSHSSFRMRRVRCTATERQLTRII